MGKRNDRKRITIISYGEEPKVTHAPYTQAQHMAAEIMAFGAAVGLFGYFFDLFPENDFTKQLTDYQNTLIFVLAPLTAAALFVVCLPALDHGIHAYLTEHYHELEGSEPVLKIGACLYYGFIRVELLMRKAIWFLCFCFVLVMTQVLMAEAMREDFTILSADAAGSADA